jgi:hypothetical protein
MGRTSSAAQPPSPASNSAIVSTCTIRIMSVLLGSAVAGAPRAVL